MTGPKPHSQQIPEMSVKWHHQNGLQRPQTRKSQANIDQTRLLRGRCSSVHSPTSHMRGHTPEQRRCFQTEPNQQQMKNRTLLQGLARTRMIQDERSVALTDHCPGPPLEQSTLLLPRLWRFVTRGISRSQTGTSLTFRYLASHSPKPINHHCISRRRWRTPGSRTGAGLDSTNRMRHRTR